MTPRPLSVLYSYPFTLGAPGIGTTAAHQIQGLVRRGHHVHVVAASAQPWAVAGVASLDLTMTLLGRRIPHRVLGVPRTLEHHDRATVRRLRAHRTVDVVHGWPMASRHTFAAARSLGVVSFREAPNTHTGHAYRVVDNEMRRLGLTLPRGNSHAVDPRRLAREAAEYGAADIILAPSDTVTRTFVDEGVSAAKVLRHRYGFDPDRFIAPTIGRTVTRDVPHGLDLLFVGRGEPRKGLHHAVRAFVGSDAARLGGRFRIAGTILPEYRRLMAGELAHDSIVEVGNRDGIPVLMAAADVLVLPSIEEGSALVTYEAMGSGCALLVSNAAGAYADHGSAALVHRVGDVDQLRTDLNRLCNVSGLLGGSAARCAGITRLVDVGRGCRAARGVLPHSARRCHVRHGRGLGAARRVVRRRRWYPVTGDGVASDVPQRCR